MNLQQYRKEYNKKLMLSLKNKESVINTYVQYDLAKTNSMFKYNNLPDTIEKHNIEDILQMHGYGVFTEFKDDLYVLCGNDAPPLNANYEPTKIIIANPYLPLNKTLTYGEDCILIKNDPHKIGLLPILERYNAFLCETDITLLCALINMRVISLLTANTDREKESAELFFNKIELGDFSVLLNEQFSANENYLNTLPYSNINNGYITQIIEIEQYLRGIKYNELGLQSNYNMKRERLTSSETDLNEDSLRPLIDTMLEEREKAIDNVNKKYGTNISVELNSSWKDNVSRETLKEDLMSRETLKEDITDEKEDVKDEDN